MKKETKETVLGIAALVGSAFLGLIFGVGIGYKAREPTAAYENTLDSGSTYLIIEHGKSTSRDILVKQPNGWYKSIEDIQKEEEQLEREKRSELIKKLIGGEKEK
jgi:hypothetical protein